MSLNIKKVRSAPYKRVILFIFVVYSVLYTRIKSVTWLSSKGKQRNLWEHQIFVDVYKAVELYFDVTCMPFYIQQSILPRSEQCRVKVMSVFQTTRAPSLHVLEMYVCSNRRLYTMIEVLQLAKHKCCRDQYFNKLSQIYSISSTVLVIKSALNLSHGL